MRVFLRFHTILTVIESVAWVELLQVGRPKYHNEARVIGDFETVLHTFCLLKILQTSSQAVFVMSLRLVIVIIGYALQCSFVN